MDCSLWVSKGGRLTVNELGRRGGIRHLGWRVGRAALTLCLLATLAVVATPSQVRASARGGDFAAWTVYNELLDARRVQTPKVNALPASQTPSSPQLGIHNKDIKVIGRQLFNSDPNAESPTTTNSDVAMDPNNVDHMVAVFQEGQFPDGGALDTAYSTTQDGGRTWSSASLPGLTVPVGGPYARAGNPRVAFGPDGTVYVASQVFDLPACASGVAVNTSLDGGLTWGMAQFPQQDTSCGVLDDMPNVVVDTYPGSPYAGRVYLVWDQIVGTDQPIELLFSDDQGQTWSSPIQVTPVGVKAIAPIPLVQPDGSLTVYYSQPTALLETVQTSKDGGATFAPPVVIQTNQGADPPDMRAGAGLGIGDAAVDPITGDLYVVWADKRFSRWGVNDILLARSTDGGLTWPPPLRLAGDTANPIDHLTPAISAFNGFLAATWYHRYIDPEGINHVNRGFTYSPDGGVTWSRRLMIGCHKRNLSMRLLHAAKVDGLYFLGDYSSVLTTAVDAHPVWTVEKFASQQQYDQATWTATMEYVLSGKSVASSC